MVHFKFVKGKIKGLGLAFYMPDVGRWSIFYPVA